MTALEPLARVAEEKGTWGHQLAPRRGAALKAARSDDGDEDVRVLLFERAILRTGSTDNIGDRPAAALGQHARREMAWGTVRSARGQSPVQLDRNFRQEFLSRRAVQQSSRPEGGVGVGPAPVDEQEV